MLSSTIHSSVRSGAERRVFRLIRDAPGSDSWVCLHSLGLARHEHKRRGEIDFLLITHLGIYVLEVKGGRVRRENGVWIHTDRYGQDSHTLQSPFDQASSAMFALERDLQTHVPEPDAANVLFGYGVMFPDIAFESVGSDGHPDLVFDLHDRGRGFTSYIHRLAAFTRHVQPQPRRGLSPIEIAKVADYLRGDFDFAPPTSVVIGDAREQLRHLTLEQRSVLDAVDIEARLLIDGPAGTGKSVLAMEAARRDARRGKRVLLLCYNRLLASFMQTQLSSEAYTGSVVMCTVHAHFRDVIERSSLSSEFHVRSQAESQKTFFDKTFPELAALACMEDAMYPFDTLIVDEAQDVLNAGTLAALIEMLGGTLDSGRWRFFLDANNQACVYRRMDPDVVTQLRHAATRSLLLTLNCRNTKPIALQTNIVAAPTCRGIGRVDGPPVEFFSYTTYRQAMGKLKKILDDLRHEGAAPGQVSVLFPHQPDDTAIRRLSRLGVSKLRDTDVQHLGSANLRDFTWATVSGFKGLENDIVVLAGIERIDTDWWRAVTYVGMSRARVRLYVINHADCDDIRLQRFQDELQRRVDEGEGWP